MRRKIPQAHYFNGSHRICSAFTASCEDKVPEFAEINSNVLDTRSKAVSWPRSVEYL